MKNIFPTLILIILAILSSQQVYAHGNSTDSENRDMERKEASAQQDRDTWDDFMKAVKQQEDKPANSETADTAESTDSLPASHSH